jgi:hypothetical protein
MPGATTPSYLPLEDFDMNGLAFDANAVIHYSVPANIYRFANNVTTPVITTAATPIQGVLELTGGISEAP